MYSIKFPDMLSSARTNLVSDRDATLSNLKLLLSSDRYSLLGDPYYGTNLKKLIFEQSDALLKDIIIDEIYTSIQMFMPQIYVERKFIDVETDGINVYAKLKVINKLDHVTDLYEICLTNYT